MRLRIDRLSNFNAIGLSWSVEDKEVCLQFLKLELVLTWSK